MHKYPHLSKEPTTELDWFEALMSLARFLRTPDGCPWDREQNSSNFTKYMIGEAEELAEAIVSNKNSHIEEEAGDTLFTLLAVIAAAEEEGRLTLEDTLRRIHEKMIRRHEHVFGDEKAETPEDAVRMWEKIKKQEKEGNL